MLYEIFDINHFTVLGPSNTIEADRHVDAARKYLESIGEGNKTLKVSARNDVRIKVSPVVMKDGRLFRLAGRGIRQLWFEVSEPKSNKQDPIF
ncbi:MAG: hypothetical protein ABSF21_00200 [Dehalococcoidia bacterium]|jgi:hypothetical protein